MLTNIRNDIEEKIKTLEHQTKFYVDEIKKRVEQITIGQKVNIISYFTTSVNISHNNEQESLCLGSYHIRNIGNQLITNPYFYIKLPEDSPFSFSGKYVYSQLQKKTNDPIVWERFNDIKKSDEFWLRPIDPIAIKPNETISFTNFQISWSNNKSYSGVITGITYCDEVHEGLEVVNPISLSGIHFSLGDGYGNIE